MLAERVQRAAEIEQGVRIIRLDRRGRPEAFEGVRIASLLEQRLASFLQRGDIGD